VIRLVDVGTGDAIWSCFLDIRSVVLLRKVAKLYPHTPSKDEKDTIETLKLTDQYDLVIFYSGIY